MVREKFGKTLRKKLLRKSLVAAAFVLILVLYPGSAAFAGNSAQSKAEAQAKKSAESAASAESEAKQKAEADAQKQEKSANANAYRVDFSVSEVEEGKKINTRQYSMNSRSGDWNEIKIGTRVPVDSNKESNSSVYQYQYLDVGTNIRCRLMDQADLTAVGGDVALSVTADITNFAIPDQQGQQHTPPVIRQLRISASTVVALGKPMVVGVVDDPNSKRQFQLEVTVTKLK
jgi:Tfp pilus assembly major pilin PilA